MPGRKKAAAHKREMEEMGRGGTSLHSYFQSEEAHGVRLHAIQRPSLSACAFRVKPGTPFAHGRYFTGWLLVSGGFFLNGKTHARSGKGGGWKATMRDDVTQNEGLVLKQHRALDLSLSQCHA